jgi:hypothetical protein
LGGLYENTDVRVEIFDNVSERRTHEFDLTSAVLHEMASRGFRLNARDAPHVLRGRILDIRDPSVVEGKSDVVLVGSLQYRVEVELCNASGERRWREEKTEAVSFTASRGESLESARQEVFDRLARWIVTRFEKEW